MAWGFTPFISRAYVRSSVHGLACYARGERATGLRNLRAIAAELNRPGIPTASGRVEWQPVQVSRVLARIAEWGGDRGETTGAAL
jgi:hypothetical protein